MGMPISLWHRGTSRTEHWERGWMELGTISVSGSQCLVFGNYKTFRANCLVQGYLWGDSSTTRIRASKKDEKSRGKKTPFVTLETRKNWTELTFAKTSGTVTREWPIADQCVPSNNPRNNCGKRFGSSSLLVCKVANVTSFHLYCGVYQL